MMVPRLVHHAVGAGSNYSDATTLADVVETTQQQFHWRDKKNAYGAPAVAVVGVDNKVAAAAAVAGCVADETSQFLLCVVEPGSGRDYDDYYEVTLPEGGTQLSDGRRRIA